MQSTGVEPRADRAGFAFHDIRFGFWAGIGGVLTTLIVGGKTVWMVALIVGLVIGLLSGSNESIKTPQEGARYGALNGAIAGVLLLIGQLLRRSEERRVGKECRSRWS